MTKSGVSIAAYTGLSICLTPVHHFGRNFYNISYGRNQPKKNESKILIQVKSQIPISDFSRDKSHPSIPFHSLKSITGKPFSCKHHSTSSHYITLI